MQDKYQYIVIGSGPAGHVSAITAAKMGLKTAMIEKKPNMLGGVCLNEGCIPAKSLYSSSRLFGEIKKYPGIFGSGVNSSSGMLKEMVKRSRAASDSLRLGLHAHLKKLGVDLIEGSAKFENESSVKIELSGGSNIVISSENILIATGSTPRALSGTPFIEDLVISSSAAVKMERLPENILIVGGGAIGVEFASFFSTMGSKVTLVEAQAEILPNEDRDVSSTMRTILKRTGADILTSSSVKNMSQRNNGVLCGIKSPEGNMENVYNVVLVSVGREPSTGSLCLEKAGVKVDERGFIPVDKYMKTNVKGIYAAGDVVQSPMLAHVAQAEGELAAFSVCGKNIRPIDYSSVPNAVYAGVQAASVGLTENEAREKSKDIVIGKSFFKANGKAVASGEEEGFVKIVTDSKSRVVIGAHIVGTMAAEMIHEFVIAKRLALTVDEIAGTIHAHPTFSESAQLAAKDILFKF